MSDRALPELSKFDQNPFRILPEDTIMVEHKLIYFIMKNFCERLFALKIEADTPYYAGFATADDIVNVYDNKRQRRYTGFWGTTEVDNSHVITEIRIFLEKMGWSAKDLADEYDRQHGNEVTTRVKTGDEQLDAVVNDILRRHGRAAAIAYLNGLKQQALTIMNRKDDEIY